MSSMARGRGKKFALKSVTLGVAFFTSSSSFDRQGRPVICSHSVVCTLCCIVCVYSLWHVRKCVCIVCKSKAGHFLFFSPPLVAWRQFFPSFSTLAFRAHIEFSLSLFLNKVLNTLCILLQVQRASRACDYSDRARLLKAR